MAMLSEENILHLKSNLPQQLGFAIKSIRKRKNITQSELAELTNKDRQYIYKIEKGIVTSNIVTIGIIARALDITLEELFKEL